MVETCCCGCCTVAKGTLIIAVLDIIGGIFSVIRNAATAHLMINNPNEMDPEAFPGFKENQAIYITMCFVGIFMALGYLIVSTMLLQGYRTRNHRLCMPWLFWNYISLTLVAVGVVIGFVILAFHGMAAPGIIMVIIFGCVLAIAMYFVLVVQRFVNELKGTY